MTKFVNCPPSFTPLFEVVEARVAKLLDDRVWDTDTGAHFVAGERYVMFRAESMAVSVREELEKLLGSSTDTAIYKIGKAIGASDCRYIAGRFPDLSPEQKLAMGPISFALSGFAHSTVREESNPVPDDSYLLFIEHPNSFEAESFKRKGIATSKTVCWLTAGYSAGWCSEAMGIQLDTREVSCTARGDDKCIFVMCPQKKLREVAKELCAKHGLPDPW